MLLSIFAFIFGSLWGSFANVLIYRLPRDLSVVSPRSRCSNCLKTILWYHNVPILSFIILRGKCANCRHSYSWRYPFVELVAGVASLYLFPEVLSSENLLLFLINFFIFLILLAHFYIDLDYQILPDSLNLVLFFLVTLVLLFKKNYLEAFTGGGIGFLFPFAVTYIFYKLRGQIGLGGGDIKLFTILGFLFGPLGILQNIFLSCFLGAVVGFILISLKRIDKNKPFAFGPMIIIVTIFQLYFPKLFSLFNFLP
jgi:prepilin signal peptidase PulO-like enzyme (type II secretory pathway)